MKNHEVVELAERLTGYASQIKALKGAKFGYCIIKNTEALGKEAKAVVDAKKVNEDFTKYDAERIVVCEKFAEKDEKGEIKKRPIGPGKFEYIIDQSNEDFKAAIAELQTKYADAITAQTTNDQDYFTFLNEENTTFVPYKISIEAVPNEISIEVLSVIKSFIQE